MATGRDFEFPDSKYLDKYLDALYEKAKSSTTLTFNRKLKIKFDNTKDSVNSGRNDPNKSCSDKSLPIANKDRLSIHSHNQNNSVENLNLHTNLTEWQRIPRNFDPLQRDLSEERRYEESLNFYVNKNCSPDGVEATRLITKCPPNILGPNRLNAKCSPNFLGPNGLKTKCSQNILEASRLPVKSIEIENVALKRSNTNFQNDQGFGDNSKSLNKNRSLINLSCDNSNTSVDQNHSQRNFSAQQISSSIKRHSLEKHFSHVNVPRNKRFRKYSDPSTGDIQKPNISDSGFVQDKTERASNSEHLFKSQKDKNIPSVKSSYKCRIKRNSMSSMGDKNMNLTAPETITQGYMDWNTQLYSQFLFKDTDFKRTEYTSSKEETVLYTNGHDGRTVGLNKTADHLHYPCSLDKDSELLFNQSIDELFEGIYRRKFQPTLKFRRKIKSRSLPSSIPATVSQKDDERSKKQEKDICDHVENVISPTLIDKEVSDTDSNKSGILSERPKVGTKDCLASGEENNEDRTKSSNYSHMDGEMWHDKDKRLRKKKRSATEEKIEDSDCKIIKHSQHKKKNCEEKYDRNKRAEKYEQFREYKKHRTDNNATKSEIKISKNNGIENTDYRKNLNKRKIENDKYEISLRRNVDRDLNGRYESSQHKDRFYDKNKHRAKRNNHRGNHNCKECEKRKKSREKDGRQKCDHLDEKIGKHCAEFNSKNLKEVSNHKSDENSSEKKVSKITFFHHFCSKKHMKTRGVLKIIQQKQRLKKELTLIDHKIQDMILQKHEKQVNTKPNAYDCLDDLDEKVSLIDDLDAALPTSHVNEWSNGERQYALRKNNQSEQLLHNGGIWKSITKEKV